MPHRDDISNSATEVGSAGGTASRRCVPGSPHSRSSSVLGNEETSHARNASDTPFVSGFAQCAGQSRLDRPRVRFQSADDRSTRKLSSDATAYDAPPRSYSDAIALSSSTAFDGSCKGSDSEVCGGDSSLWHLQRKLSEGAQTNGVRQGVAAFPHRQLWQENLQEDEDALFSKLTSDALDDCATPHVSPVEAAEDSPAYAADESPSTSITTTKRCQQEEMPQLPGEGEAKTCPRDRMRLPRKKYSTRHRTSKYMGVGSSNRKNQWQARILVHGKVTHLGYYETEAQAARVYDRVAISLNGLDAHTNFPISQYSKTGAGEFKGMKREELQRALGVKPMDKSSRFRGVSRKKGKWEAKVMVNRKWAYRALFDSEVDAAQAYDAAVWSLKPKEAVSFVNFKEGIADRGGKRSSPRSQCVQMQRSKSQKLDSQFSAGSLHHVASQPLSLMPEDIEDIQPPLTPTRRHSVQLPLPRRPEPMGRRFSAAGPSELPYPESPEVCSLASEPPST